MLGDTDLLGELLELDTDSAAESVAAESSAADFRGSLDYIDQLPVDAPWALKSNLGRDVATITNVGFLNDLVNPPDVAPSSPTDFRQYSDRRTFHPLGDFAPIGVSRRTAADWRAPNQREFEEQGRRLREIEQRARRKIDWRKSSAPVVFADPRRNVICQKRKIRREVMAAYRFLGGRGFRKPIFKWFSKVVC